MGERRLVISVRLTESPGKLNPRLETIGTDEAGNVIVHLANIPVKNDPPGYPDIARQGYQKLLRDRGVLGAKIIVEES